MFKKLLVCLLSLVALVGCNNGGGPNPPEPSKYTLAVNCTDCTPSGNKSEYEEGASVSFTITPKDAYTLPEKKDVQVTGVTSFEYTIDSGVATFSCVMPAEAVTVTITATKQPEPEPEPTPQPGSDIPLNFTCEKGSVTIKYHFQNNAQVGAPNLEYSFDRQNWNSIEIKWTQSPETIVTINEEQPTVYFRGNNPDGFNFYPASETGVGSNFTHFTFRFSDASENLSLKVSGNIMSLLAPEGFENKFDIPRSGCFSSLFSGAKLNEEQGYDASGLMLPAVKLKDRTYYTMFEGSDIAKAPSYLPAVNAKAECYENMFYSDDKLETAPIIKLKTLADEACQFMFYGCAKLNVTEKTGATLFFTCPNDEEFNFAVFRMFANTAGSFTETPSVGEAYYYN